MPTVLGVNCAHHESSACLVKDGEIAAAVEEERFNRVKHAKRSRVDNADELPVESIAYVLRAAGVQAADVEHVGLTLDPDKRLAANRDLREPGIPAVVQENGSTGLSTSRVHVVNERANPLYARLLRELKSLSGLGMVLNTSFNISEPIVCAPEHAVRTFARSKMDALAIGPFLVRR